MNVDSNCANSFRVFFRWSDHRVDFFHGDSPNLVRTDAPFANWKMAIYSGKNGFTGFTHETWWFFLANYNHLPEDIMGIIYIYIYIERDLDMIFVKFCVLSDKTGEVWPAQGVICENQTPTAPVLFVGWYPCIHRLTKYSYIISISYGWAPVVSTTFHGLIGHVHGLIILILAGFAHILFKYIQIVYTHILVDGFNPSERKLVSWDDYSQYMGNKKCSKAPISSEYELFLFFIFTGELAMLVLVMLHDIRSDTVCWVAFAVILWFHMFFCFFTGHWLHGYSCI